MDELNLLPIYRNGLGEITSGIDVVVPKFCRGKCESNKKCKQHYEQMEKAQEGIYECPYGFLTCVFSICDDDYIFTCLKITDKYDKKKLNPKIKNEYGNYREISKAQLDKYIEAYKDFYDNQRKYEEYRAFVEDIFHDIRKFNRDIKYKNNKIYRISQQGKKYKDLLEASKNIQAMCWFMSIRLNNHDFTYNMELLEKDVKSTYNIHKIVYKVKECIKEKAKEKDVKIKLNSEQDIRDIKAYDCIELLPYLLLDNAIKYSVNDSEIIVEIEEKAGKQHVHIESLGPISEKEEQKKLFEQSFRGKYSKKLAPGMGIGLYTAKGICDLNGIEIKIESNEKVEVTRNDVPYSKFNVDFYIQI